MYISRGFGTILFFLEETYYMKIHTYLATYYMLYKLISVLVKIKNKVKIACKIEDSTGYF